MSASWRSNLRTDDRVGWFPVFLLLSAENEKRKSVVRQKLAVCGLSPSDFKLHVSGCFSLP